MPTDLPLSRYDPASLPLLVDGVLTNKAVPSMMLESALQPKGTFWFFFVVAFLGLLWAVFLLPETSHRNLEETSDMIS